MSKTIMEKLKEIQKLTDDLVVKASEIDKASSSMVYDIVKATEAIIDDQIKDALEEDNKE